MTRLLLLGARPDTTARFRFPVECGAGGLAYYEYTAALVGLSADLS